MSVIPWNELIDRAFTGRIERGRRYAAVHQYHASPFLALTGVVERTVYEMNPRWADKSSLPPAQDEEHQKWRDNYDRECSTVHHEVVLCLFENSYSGKPQWLYTGDLGLRYGGVNYLNGWNFVLDLSALAREGVTVDCSVKLDKPYRPLTELEQSWKVLDDELMDSIDEEIEDHFNSHLYY